MEDIQRPTSSETDEDLIQQQELFFKNKSKALCTQLKNTHAVQKKDPKANEAKKVNTASFSHENEMINCLLEVKENTFDLANYKFELPSSNTMDVLNKKIKKLNPSQFSSNTKKKSLFAQLLDTSESPSATVKTLPKDIYKSPSVDGSGLDTKELERELNEIHEENLAKLLSMSNEEILKQQQEIQKHLDPALIQFIKSQRKKVKMIPKGRIFSSEASNKSDLPGEVLRQEGRNKCDALILQKVNESEVNSSCDSTVSFRKKDIEIPLETKELLEKTDKGKWVNMRKIEKEKLEWLSDLPKANLDNPKTGFTARFDFEGLLLAHDVETPTFKGLHHHGEEPEVAGYSLEELFLLARSTLLSQRITALHTIAHILDNYWKGMFDGCFEDLLLSAMLEAGLVPLLRWALDDTSLTSLAATITAIHSLLISKTDEVCLQRTFCWLNGHVMPVLKPENLAEPEIIPDELTDFDLIKLDVIKAFLQMDILPRFSYILKVLQPSPLVCKLIIEICAHTAQHSFEAAEQIVKFPGFLDFITDKFLPLTFQLVDGSKLSNSVGYKSPISSALKLIRTIYSSQKNLVSREFDIVQYTCRYLLLDENEWKSEADNIHLLRIEALKTTHVLLCYNKSFSSLLPLLPVFLRQIDFCMKLDLSPERYQNFKDFEYATHLFKILEAVCRTTKKDLNSLNDCKIISNIFEKVLLCLKKWLWQLRHGNFTDHAIMLVSGCLNSISTYFENVYIHHCSEESQFYSEINDLFQNNLLLFIRSDVFKHLLSTLEFHSTLLCSKKSGNSRDSKTIVSLGSIAWKDDVTPILKENSPIPLLNAILKLSVLQKAFGDNTVLQEIVEESSLIRYLKKISSEKLNATCWFVRYEIYMLAQLVLLPSIKMLKDVSLWHCVASSLLPILRAPDESIAQDLFKNIIFNPDFILSIQNSISDDITKKELSARLSVFELCYTTSLLEDEKVTFSRNLLAAQDCKTMMASSNSQFVLPKDWFYMPIWHKYQNSKHRTSDKKLTTDDEVQLLSCLEWILLSYKLTLPLVENIPGSVDFSYLCMVFLLDEDFFRIHSTQKLLEACLYLVLKQKKVRLANIKWSTLNAFEDLYMEMLNQYEAVSYGDELFGNFLVFPLQQCYPSSWKKLLLSEHSQVLRFLRTKISKLFVPIQCYLEPLENELSVITEYHKLLKSGSFISEKCPLVYAMAKHHTENFTENNSKP